MKLFYMIYFAGIALFMLNSISYAIWARKNNSTKWARLAKAVLFSGFWPLALFSDEGRKVLLSRIEKL